VVNLPSERARVKAGLGDWCTLRFEHAMIPSEIIFNIEESPEGGYQARALGFSIFTEADSLEELKTMIRDAISCHFGLTSQLFD
jgi:hypothetical protein